ncbi:MAG TPA: imidazole glycerol phosphate synthase subunit HisH [Candidatus Omnitrophota bacterium]|nr:imidazole glycerol phosphate synthase subunit HisH [Candidatus Omnitrophota bacterium]
MIAIIDYGSGNLRSVHKALEHVGARAQVTDQPEDILKADKIILPGVGAIAPAIQRLSALNLVDPIKKAIKDGKPFLGICLGLQLLFDESCEGGTIKTLGILAGKVKRFQNLKVPHMGWNELAIKRTACPFLKNIQPLTHAYFCHSFFVEPQQKDIIATTTDYGLAFTSSVWKDNLFAVQFHPEKSQEAGLTILKNFCAFSI